MEIKCPICRKSVNRIEKCKRRFSKGIWITFDMCERCHRDIYGWGFDLREEVLRKE